MKKAPNGEALGVGGLGEQHGDEGIGRGAHQELEGVFERVAVLVEESGDFVRDIAGVVADGEGGLLELLADEEGDWLCTRR